MAPNPDPPSAERRVLVLAPFVPHREAPHGGGRAMAYLIEGIATRHHVALLYLQAPGEPALDPALHGMLDAAQAVPRPLPSQTRLGRWRRRARLLFGLLRGAPTLVTDFAVPTYTAALERLATQWRPDLVQVEFHLMAHYLPVVRRALPGRRVPRVLTEHEPGAAVAAERLRLARGAGAALAWLEARAWTAYERWALAQVDAVVAFTERDRCALAALAPAARIERIPLGGALPERPLDPLGVPGQLLFVGNFAHAPNADAARRLVERIFPRLRQRHPDSTLCIVGPEPPAELVTHRQEGVVVTGRVPDVTPYLDAAAVVAVPLRLGGGMRVKVLEALAAGKAVVASPRAVEGLAVTDGEQVLLAETDEAFAGRIADLLDRPEEQAALARRARDWACANLGWERTAMAYNVLYQSLLDRCPLPA